MQVFQHGRLFLAKQHLMGADLLQLSAKIPLETLEFGFITGFVSRTGQRIKINNSGILAFQVIHIQINSALIGFIANDHHRRVFTETLHMLQPIFGLYRAVDFATGIQPHMAN